MKIIFSRKGFDSSFGGRASPIVDGRPITMPTPAGNDPSVTTYGQIQSSPSMGELVGDLTNGKYGASALCHMDPDLEGSRLGRSDGWRASLGQCGPSLTHLRNQSVGAGDLFLFYGLFAEARKAAGRWKFVGKPHHRIFGWLSVGEVIDVSDDHDGLRRRAVLRDRPWLAGHPHLLDGWCYAKPETRRNALFVASNNAKVFNEALCVSGAGVLQRGFRLTVPGESKVSMWQVPLWMNPHHGGRGLSYHDRHRWTEGGTLKTTSPGQEFVADISGAGADAGTWIRDVLTERVH